MWERLQSLDRPIRVAMIGAGFMGKGLFLQCERTPGFECVALADIKIDRAIGAAEAAERDYEIVESEEAMADAIARGRLVITDRGDLVAECFAADVVIEASTAVGEGGRFAVAALESGKHLGLVNAETDLVFGPYLLDLARRKGLTYTSVGGDQHGVIRHLVDEIRLWGFDLVMAGNIKGFLDRRANPTNIIAEADKRDLDHKVCAGFTDGSKLNIEMALAANALGLRTDIVGMHGPKAKHVQEALHLFDLDRIWREGGGVVDYILGAEPGGGVFVIGRCDDPHQQEKMAYYKMGDGPFYIFYRPYHLPHIEALGSVATAVLDERALLKPDHGFKTNVFAYAKEDLPAGRLLDGVGGYSAYGMIDNLPSDGLPLCLAEETTLKRAIAKDDAIRFDDIEDEPDSYAWELYRKALEASNTIRI